MIHFLKKNLIDPRQYFYYIYKITNRCGLILTGFQMRWPVRLRLTVGMLTVLGNRLERCQSSGFWFSLSVYSNLENNELLKPNSWFGYTLHVSHSLIIPLYSHWMWLYSLFSYYLKLFNPMFGIKRLLCRNFIKPILSGSFWEKFKGKYIFHIISEPWS